MAKKTSQKKNRLVILDTHAIMHRAYHAIPDLSTSSGEPTGALFGLSSMLLKAVEDLEPDYIVAARDRAEKTHRHDVYEAYKGTRLKTDDALVAQLKQNGDVFDAFGIPVFDSPGFEADDIIGTLAEQLAHRDDVQTIILTGDMDMLQLIVDGRVIVYRLITGLSNLKLYDEATVREKYGFGPEHVTDFKGISGDSSDNIKGVPGVGEGSAMKLIQMFGDIDRIYRALKTDGVEAVAKRCGIQKRYAQLVADNEESARFSKQLATIRRDAPVVFELPDHPWRLADHQPTIEKLFDRLEFRSLKTRLQPLATAAGAEPEPEASDEQIDAEVLRETSIALWLLHSDTTNPSLDDMLMATNARDFASARAQIFEELKKTGRLQEVFDHIERPLMPVVEAMNARGVYVDVPQLKALEREYRKELAAVAARVYRAAGHEFNIGSPKQLAAVLYDELHIGAGARVRKTSTGARTTREDELTKLAEENPVVADVLMYRELQKLLGTYIEKMPKLVDGENRLHAEFVQAGTTTGRMSSQNPNLQNIPVQTENGRRIRDAFAAPRGRVIASLDYSQIELRLAAGLSGDEKLVAVFKEGGDVHRAVASDVFGVPPERVDKEMRRRAKVINFGILYGMGANALRSALGAGVSHDEAARYLADYFSRYAGLARFVEETKRSATRLGYTETIFGRRRYFPGLKSSLPHMRSAAERMAVNAPMQGTQSDIIKLAMIEADELIERSGWRANASLVMQVHDELVYELDEHNAERMARAIREAMEKVAPVERLSGVPILAEIAIGPSWGQTKPIAR
jgi:DNA polymerase-1